MGWNAFKIFCHILHRKAFRSNLGQRRKIYWSFPPLALLPSLVWLCSFQAFVLTIIGISLLWLPLLWKYHFFLKSPKDRECNWEVIFKLKGRGKVPLAKIAGKGTRNIFDCQCCLSVVGAKRYQKQCERHALSIFLWLSSCPSEGK